MKKITVVLGVLILIFTTPSITASARCNSRKATSRTYATCTVEDCNTVGRHIHDNAIYCGHYIGDGHDYHQLCEVEGCVEIDSHEHDGVIYMPNDSNYGYGCYNYGYGCSGRRY